MARASTMSSAVSDTTPINLTRILSRLERTILSADSDPQLRKSSFERAKASANLEHARLLLLRLEHDSSSIQGQARKQSVQADLQEKRELIKQLNQRLSELNQLDDSSDDGSSASSDEDNEADPPPSYAPARPDASTGLDRQHDPEKARIQDAAEVITSSLRSRRAQPTSIDSATKSTGNALFHGANTNSSADPTVAQNEMLLSHNRAEQENLTSSLLSMAQALKTQSLQFGSSLESEKAVLGRASEGLDRNAQGMESAGQRIRTLKRMTEGKSWWERMMTYAMIAGLWVVLVLIVALVPKLR